MEPQPHPFKSKKPQQNTAIVPLAQPIGRPTTPMSLVQGTPGPPPSQTSSDTPLSQAPTEIEEALIDAEAKAKLKAVLSGAENANNFKPYQELQKTEIRLEFGDEVEDYYTIHLELLGCYTKAVVDTFKKAQPLRNLYAEAVALWSELESVIMPELSSEAFTDQRTYKQAMQILHKCLTSYPIQKHGTYINDELEKFANDHLFNDNKKMQNSAKNANLREMSLPQCLKFFNPTGVKIVTMELYNILWTLKTREADAAQKNPLKAAAQGRVILEGTDRLTVRSVVEWIYQRELRFGDARHLCQIYALAEKLAVVDLAQTCMTKLSMGAREAIAYANAQGLSLRYLLDQRWESDSDTSHDVASGNIVVTVFNFVLGEENPPPVLQDLVIKTLSARHN